MCAHQPVAVRPGRASMMQERRQGPTYPSHKTASSPARLPVTTTIPAPTIAATPPPSSVSTFPRTTTPLARASFAPRRASVRAGCVLTDRLRSVRSRATHALLLGFALMLLASAAHPQLPTARRATMARSAPTQSSVLAANAREHRFSAPVASPAIRLRDRARRGDFRLPSRAGPSTT